VERLTIDGDETTALRPVGETRCGWCGHTTTPARCGYCGRDPATPYRHRGEELPVVEPAKGRPGLDNDDIRRRLAGALDALGPHATVESLAELLDVSPRTVRRWKNAVDGR
jgi:hypothetical protein